MESIAVIAEFNPFHTGHAYLLSEIRRQSPADAAIIVILSGSFVQRGEPAFFDKWHRARWAVRNGADAVFELPAVYALSSAEGFASGGVRLAHRLSCTSLACGVEDGTADAFLRLAETALTKAPGAETKAATAGRNQTEDLKKALPESAHLLEQPNALLALEYAKAVLRLPSSLTLMTIPRKGSHHEKSLGQSFTSASALRKALENGFSAEAAAYFPESICADVEGLVASGIFSDYVRYHDFVILQGRLLTAEQLRRLPAFTEGLENRWHKAFSTLSTYDEALSAIKTKRYAFSRLCRMGAYTVLQPSQDFFNESYQEGPQYGRILAFNDRGAAFLKTAKKAFPIITKVTQEAKSLSPLGQTQLTFDIRATDIQSLCFRSDSCRQGRRDYYTSPCYLSQADHEQQY